jgi:hypothetical protein
MAKAVKARFGKDHGIQRGIFSQLFQARGHIPADGGNPETGPQIFELTLAPVAACGDSGTIRQAGDAARMLRDKNLGCIRAFRDGPQHQPRRQVNGQVFQTVNRDVNFPRPQGLLELFREETFPEVARMRQVNVQAIIAQSPDQSGLDGKAGVGGNQQAAHDGGLRLSQSTFPCAKDKGPHELKAW